MQQLPVGQPDKLRPGTLAFAEREHLRLMLERYGHERLTSLMARLGITAKQTFYSKLKKYELTYNRKTRWSKR